MLVKLVQALSKKSDLSKLLALSENAIFAIVRNLVQKCLKRYIKVGIRDGWMIHLWNAKVLESKAILVFLY